MLENIEFLNKELFWVMLALPLALLWYVLTNKRQTSELKMSTLHGFKIQRSIWGKLRHVLFGLRLVALALLITALARSQNGGCLHPN